VTNSMILNQDNAFERILAEMVSVHRRKVKDYAGSAHPNENFYDSANQTGLTAGHSVETLIATKQARLKVLLPNYWTSNNATPANESIYDTLLDRAVYAVIALTIWNEQGYIQSAIGDTHDLRN